MAEKIDRSPLGILKATITEWSKDKAPRLSAALAYHTIFAVAPLLIISVSVVGLVLGAETTRAQVVRQVLDYTNSPSTADLVATILRQMSERHSANVIGTVVGILALLLGASSLFAELKAALNEIWDVPEQPSRGILGLVIQRAFALLMVLVSGLVLLLSLILTTALARATGWIESNLPGTAIFSQLLAFLLLLAITMAVFAIIYRFVPDLAIAWHDVLSGALVTAFLFSIGRLLIGVFLGFSTAASAYGAAGSVIVLLLWVYYSALIFFLGAEFTQVYARTRGTRRQEEPLLQEPAQEKSGAVP